MIEEILRERFKGDNIKNKVNKKMEYKNHGLLRETWDFLKIRKKWWLLPIIILFVLIGALIIFGQSSVLSPFIYALG